MKKCILKICIYTVAIIIFIIGCFQLVSDYVYAMEKSEEMQAKVAQKVVLNEELSKREQLLEEEKTECQLLIENLSQDIGKAEEELALLEKDYGTLEDALERLSDYRTVCEEEILRAEVAYELLELNYQLQYDFSGTKDKQEEFEMVSNITKFFGIWDTILGASFMQDDEADMVAIVAYNQKIQLYLEEACEALDKIAVYAECLEYVYEMTEEKEELQETFYNLNFLDKVFATDGMDISNWLEPEAEKLAELYIVLNSVADAYENLLSENSNNAFAISEFRLFALKCYELLEAICTNENAEAVFLKAYEKVGTEMTDIYYETMKEKYCRRRTTGVDFNTQDSFIKGYGLIDVRHFYKKDGAGNKKYFLFEMIDNKLNIYGCIAHAPNGRLQFIADGTRVLVYFDFVGNAIISNVANQDTYVELSNWLLDNFESNSFYNEYKKRDVFYK